MFFPRPLAADDVGPNPTDYFAPHIEVVDVDAIVPVVTRGVRGHAQADPRPVVSRPARIPYHRGFRRDDLAQNWRLTGAYSVVHRDGNMPTASGPAGRMPSTSLTNRRGAPPPWWRAIEPPPSPVTEAAYVPAAPPRQPVEW